MHSSRFAFCCALLTGAVLTLGTPTASAAAVPVPAAPRHLPQGIEALPAYVPQDSCDPVSKRGVLAFEKLILETYPDTGTYGIATACIPGDVSEHHEGRAWDWAINRHDKHQVAEVHALFHWLLAKDANGDTAAMARRLGIMYIIWDKRILGLYRLSDGWRPYACSGVTACHQNHVHFSFTWAGAQKRTSYWTGRVAAQDFGPCRVAGLSFAPPDNGTPNTTPCPAAPGFGPMPKGAPNYLGALRAWSGAILRRGATGSGVTAVQQALGVGATGFYDSALSAAVKAFQSKHHLARSGVVDEATWESLLSAVTPAATSSGRKGASATASSAPADPGWPTPRVPVKPARLRAHLHVLLREGSSGRSVKVLQRAVGTAPDGAFGPKTLAAVQKFQRYHHQRATGVVSASTWHALAMAAWLDPYRTLLLQQGSSGAAVAVVQRLLHITADGAFGPQTLRAVKHFQRTHHMPVSGVVDHAMWAAFGA